MSGSDSGNLEIISCTESDGIGGWKELSVPYCLVVFHFPRNVVYFLLFFVPTHYFCQDSDLRV